MTHNQIQTAKPSIKSRPLLACLMLLIIPPIVCVCTQIVWQLLEGDQIGRYTSPNGDHTLTVYLLNGGATTAFAIRGAITYNKLLWFTRNVYYQYECSEACVEWVSPDEVKINGEIINIWKDNIKALSEEAYPLYFV